MKINKLVLILFIFAPILLFGQSKSEKEKLEQKKAELLAERNSLKKTVDSLTKESSDLEEKVTLALRDLYITKYGKKNGVNVSYGRVWNGMTEKMLMDSWGKPDKIDKNVETYGVFTQWYYGDVTYFFRDGILTEGDEK